MITHPRNLQALEDLEIDKFSILFLELNDYLKCRNKHNHVVDNSWSPSRLIKHDTSPLSSNHCSPSNSSSDTAASSSFTANTSRCFNFVSLELRRVNQNSLLLDDVFESRSGSELVNCKSSTRKEYEDKFAIIIEDTFEESSDEDATDNSDVVLIASSDGEHAVHDNEMRIKELIEENCDVAREGDEQKVDLENEQKVDLENENEVGLNNEKLKLDLNNEKKVGFENLNDNLNKTRFHDKPSHNDAIISTPYHPFDANTAETCQDHMGSNNNLSSEIGDCCLRDDEVEELADKLATSCLYSRYRVHKRAPVVNGVDGKSSTLSASIVLPPQPSTLSTSPASPPRELSDSNPTQTTTPSAFPPSPARNTTIPKPPLPSPSSPRNRIGPMGDSNLNSPQQTCCHLPLTSACSFVLQTPVSLPRHTSTNLALPAIHASHHRLLWQQENRCFVVVMLDLLSSLRFKERRKFMQRHQNACKSL